MHSSTNSNWKEIAIRLSETGWSWQHLHGSTRNFLYFHAAIASNENDLKHIVIAPTVALAFDLIEQSIATMHK